MPDPDDPTSPSPVAPTKPTAAQEAGTTQAGEVESASATARELKPGKYGSQTVTTHSKNAENQDKTHWIEIEFIDDADQPVPGVAIDVECPDSSVASVTTDDKGKARVAFLDSGTCKITPTGLDKDAWEPA